MSLTNEIFYEVKHIETISNIFFILSDQYITQYYDEETNYIVYVFKELFDITLDQASNVLLESSFAELPQIHNIFSVIEGNNTKVYITFDNFNNSDGLCKEDVFIDGIRPVYIFNRKLSIFEIKNFLEQDNEMITVSNAIVSKNKSTVTMVHYTVNLDNLTY